MGRRASSRGLVDRAPLRFTELMSGMYSWGITPGASLVVVVVAGAVRRLGAAPAGAGALVVEGAGATVVVGSSWLTRSSSRLTVVGVVAGGVWAPA